MCGICGLVSRDGVGGREQAVIREMSAALVHRGPDSDGYWSDGAAGLAARRLSIIDLEHGDQPIANETGRIHVVQNGEIYNYRALADRLVRQGHRLRTGCDTEVLVHLYEQLGDDFVHELRGMFAIALWDGERKRLVLARDRFGIKPLLYSQADGRLAFASELRALERVPWVSTELDLEGLEAYLATNSVPGPMTILRDARKLLPGHLLTWEGGEVSLRRYARPAPVSRAEVRDEPERALAAELRGRLRDSVRAHLVADVPVGVLLSGGIDSSALTALAAQESEGPVSTFSIGFEERSFDELERARAVARRYGTDHHELVLRPHAAELLPEIVAAFDEPLGDSSALPTYLVSRLAAEHVKVVLSGEGGDELFGGYYTYVADMLATRLGPVAGVARPAVELLPSSSKKVSLDYRLKRFVRAADRAPLERHQGWKEIFSDSARDELMLPGGRGAGHPLDRHRALYAETGEAEPLARLQDLDIATYLVDDLLVKTDRASMAHSLEVRVPFLDPAVAELALALPTRAKVRLLRKKRLLRRAVSGLVPRSVAYGRKQGFSIPAAAWLRGELEPFAREVLSPERIRGQGYLRPEAVTGVLDSHVAGREDLSRQLWGLMSLSLWLEGRRG